PLADVVHVLRGLRPPVSVCIIVKLSGDDVPLIEVRVISPAWLRSNGQPIPQQGAERVILTRGSSPYVRPRRSKAFPITGGNRKRSFKNGGIIGFECHNLLSRHNHRL